MAVTESANPKPDTLILSLFVHRYLLISICSSVQNETIVILYPWKMGQVCASGKRGTIESAKYQVKGYDQAFFDHYRISALGIV